MPIFGNGLVLAFLLVCCVLLASCDRHRADMAKDKVVVIQPFQDFPASRAILVFNQLRRINSQTILRHPIAMPEKAYYPPRNRFRAEMLIAYLRARVGGDTIIVGLTGRDISTSKNGIKDWGIMGLGYCPGRSCVVSSFRLSSKNTGEQFYKVVIHEIGHTQGLPHCKNKTCFMRDAEGGNHLNEEKDFCPSCKEYLLDRGWKLSQ